MRVLFVGFLFLCVVGSATTNTSVGSAASVTIGRTAVFTGTDYPFAPAYVADARGYFAKHGVEAVVHTFPSGADAVQALRSARSGLVLAGDLPSMRTWSVGDVVGVSPVVWDDSSISVVAAKEIQTAGDLRGKRIATILGASNEIFLTIYLRQSGLRREDVQLINLGSGDMPVALARGEIVAFMGNQLTSAKALQAVPGAHYLRRGIKGLGTNRIIASAIRTTAEQDRALVVGTLKGLYDGVMFLAEQPDESHAIVARRLGVPVDVVKENIKVFNYSMAFDRAFVGDMTTESRIAVQLGMLKQFIDWKVQFRTDLLREVGRNLVTRPF